MLGTVMRSEFSEKTKLLAFKRSGGCCECGCGTPLSPGKIDYEYDHRIAAGLGGDNSLDNCVVLLRGHHREKTKYDIVQIAQAKRRERRHAGIRKQSKWPCGKNSKWKRKVSGEVVER